MSNPKLTPFLRDSGVIQKDAAKILGSLLNAFRAMWLRWIALRLAFAANIGSAINPRSVDIEGIERFLHPAFRAGLFYFFPSTNEPSVHLANIFGAMRHA